MRSLLLVMLVTATASAETAEDGSPDPDELPSLRLDGGLGGNWGDGAGAFAVRGHLGYSHWVRSDDGFTALRLTGGASLGADFTRPHAYATAAPFVEVGLAYISSRSARQATVFVRAEPVLIEGTLHERALRVGVGVTLHGYGSVLPARESGCSSSDCDDLDTFVQMAAYTVGLPVLAALNARHLEFTADVGLDGRTQYGFVVGLWGQ